jgi:ornithine cyclodeaminase/alanine dehydrogenase-like protein (mu-crystallin family)
MTANALYLSAADCENLLEPSDVISAIKDVMAWDAQGSVRWPVPRNLNIVPDAFGNDYHVKGCVLENIPIAGIRLVSHSKDESSPDCTRLVVLIDPRTSLVAGIVEERWNYSQRTVAAVALASRHLALGHASRLGLVGAGRLARASLEYYTRLFHLERIRIASRRPETREALAEYAIAAYGIGAHAVDSIEEAVRGADLVLTCTNSEQPLLDAAWIAPGAVVACLETHEPGAALVAECDLFVVDSREQLARELIALYGDQSPSRITATIGEVLAGIHPGRTSATQRVLIVTDGMASQDVAIAHRAYVRALERGLGTTLPFGSRAQEAD